MFFNLCIVDTCNEIDRDWRGLAEQAGLDVNSICSGKISPTEHCLHLWGQKGGLIGQLWTYLEAMDRFDVIDDTLQMICNMIFQLWNMEVR